MSTRKENLICMAAILMDSVGCGGHNYASKRECYKCGTPRDYGKHFIQPFVFPFSANEDGLHFSCVTILSF